MTIFGLAGDDSDELPTILPPKRRRQRTFKKMASTNSEILAVSVEAGSTKAGPDDRLAHEFPRHNWLENKINKLNSGEDEGQEECESGELETGICQDDSHIIER